MSLRALTVTALIFGICSAAASATLIVDGDLSDWGVTVADNNGSDFSSFAPGIGLVGSHVEDQDDLAGLNSYLGPRQGGQFYDAEMMAVAFKSNTLYIAIVTGQRPDNGLKYFSPGDIRINTAAGVYSIEVGGGRGGDPGSAIAEGAIGSTYTLESNGETKDHLDADPLQAAGSIWGDVNWMVVGAKPVQSEISGSSALIGTADYVYTRNDVTTQHAIIELAFNVGLLGGTLIDTVEWRPACSNDELIVPVNIVPEPATLVCLAIGGLFLLPRKRR